MHFIHRYNGACNVTGTVMKYHWNLFTLHSGTMKVTEKVPQTQDLI